MFGSKDYLPHFVTAGIISPNDLHDLSRMRSRDRAMRLLQYISDSLQCDDTQCFYKMLEIMKNHGHAEHVPKIAKKMNEAIRSGVSTVTRASSVGSDTSTKLGSFDSIRSDSIGSIATSTGESKV